MNYIQKNDKPQRQRWLKAAILLLAAAGTMILSSFPVLADDEDRTSITKVTLDIESSIEVGDVSSDVDVTTDSGECSVTNVDVVNEPNNEWEHKDKPKLEITLEAESDSYFKSGFGKKNVSITGAKGTLTTVKRKSDEEVKVVVTLNALKATDSDYDLEVDEAEWNQFTGVAGWGDSEDAKTYDLRLYRNGKFVTNANPGKNTSYDFSGNIKSAGTYTFEVRGVYSSSRKGEWQESDSFEVSEEKAAELTAAANYTQTGSGPAAGTWLYDSAGWRYCSSDGSYVTGNWQQIEGLWYFFDENGYRMSGWIVWNDKWYYLNEFGQMLANTVTPDGKAVGEDGAMLPLR